METTNTKKLEEIPDEMGCFAEMDITGDTKVIWDPKNPDDVKTASEMFHNLRSKGYLVFRLRGRKGERGDQMTEFDGKPGKFIFVPPMRGG